MKLASRLRDSLGRSKNRLVLDLNKLNWDKVEDLHPLREKLADHHKRIRVVLPRLAVNHREVLLLTAMFNSY